MTRSAREERSGGNGYSSGWINNTSKTDVALWCYKWYWDGLDLWVGCSIEHLTVLIRTLSEINWEAFTRPQSPALKWGLGTL